MISFTTELCGFPCAGQCFPLNIQYFELFLNLFVFQKCNHLSKLLHFIQIEIDGRNLRSLAGFLVTLLRALGADGVDEGSSAGGIGRSGGRVVRGGVQLLQLTAACIQLKIRARSSAIILQGVKHFEQLLHLLFIRQAVLKVCKPFGFDPSQQISRRHPY